MDGPVEIEPHNARAASTWGAGGVAYDEISRGVADAIEHTIRRLAPRPGERILDVATGSGWAARAVAERGAQVVGIDLGEDLIAAARALSASRGFGSELAFRVADAERLPFRDGEFDAVISTFGVMFASRPEAAAAELARVCRPGGRLALTTWRPGSNPARMFALMRAYLPPAPEPPPSPFAWGEPERVQDLLGSAFALGFETGTSLYREPSGEAAWETFTAGFGPVRMLAASLDEQRRADLRRDFIALHEEFRTELGITFPRDYLVAVGVRV